MKRPIAAISAAAGFLLAAGAANAQSPAPPKGPVPQGYTARLACNRIQDARQRNICIARVCASVPAPLKQACVAGTGAYASRPPVRPPVPRPVVNRPPAKPPVPNPAARRQACNNLKDPRQKSDCIAKACAPLPPAAKKVCTDGTGPFAGKPPVKPPIKPVVHKPPVKPPVKPVVGKPPLKPPVGKPNAALLNQKRSQLSKLRSEVVRLCQQVYDGKAEADCIAGAFPPIPRALPLKKPAN